MTFFMIPVSFDGQDIDGSDGIFAMAFQLPTQRVLSKIEGVAGGAVIDFDYGDDAQLQPMPFSVRFYFEGSTAGLMRANVDKLFVNKLGNSGLFVAQLHGGSATYSCTAQLQHPNFTIAAGVVGPSTAKLAGIVGTFVPVDAFTLVP